MTINELNILKTDEARQIVLDNLATDPSVFALKNRHSAASILATQLKYLQRSQSKLPTFYAVQAIIPPLAFEQCSSEKAASIKDFSGKTCLDLTCGLGVDSLHFAKNFDHVTSIEWNPVLAETVRFNFDLMHINNITVVNASAEDFVNSYTGAPFDLIYVDPARRDNSGKKVFLPEDCTPNFVELLPILRKISKKIVVKMSPLYDVEAAFRQLSNVSEIGVVSIDNECKELLLVFNSDDLITKNKPEIDTSKRSIFIKCFFKNKLYAFKKDLLLNNENQYKHNENEMLDYVLAINADFNSALNTTINAELINQNKQLNSELITPFHYLIEPDVAFYKARLLVNIPPQYFTEKGAILTASNGFFLSNDIVEMVDFPARIFRIETVFDYQPKRIAAYLKTEKITALNVVQRNFPFSTADIRTALRIREGGDLFLICTLFQGEKKAWLARRIH